MLDFFALLNFVEEHFGRIDRSHCFTESDVVLEEHHHCRFAIQILKLGEDVEDGHGGVPPHEGRIVGNLVLCFNVCIEHPEARPLNILVGEKVVLLTEECCVNHFNGGRGHPLWIDCRLALILAESLCIVWDFFRYKPTMHRRVPIFCGNLRPAGAKTVWLLYFMLQMYATQQKTFLLKISIQQRTTPWRSRSPV